MKRYVFKGKEGLEIVSLKKLTTNSIDAVSEPHRVGFYQIYCFYENTEGALEINFEKITLKPNTILFIPADVVCSFSRDAQYDGEVIIFTDFFMKKEAIGRNNILFSNVFRRFRKPQLLDLNHYPIIELVKLMQLELEFLVRKNRQQILINHLENIIAYGERIVDESEAEPLTQQPQQQLIAHFYDLINANYQKEQSLQFYCDQLNTTYSALSKTTNEVLGIAPKALLNQKIVLEAKSLLAYSNLSIKQICYKIGLNEPSYFTVFFKKYQGNTPTEFREKYKEWSKKHKTLG